MTSERPPNETLRLFVAVELPDTWLAELTRYQSEVESSTPPGRGVSWTRPEGFHLTLKFIGDYPVDRLPELLNVLSITLPAMPDLDLVFHHIYMFGGRPLPRVLAAGLPAFVEGSALHATARHIDKALVQLGVPPERRRFVPHITLARIRPEIERSRFEAFATAVRTTRMPEVPGFTPRYLSLMRSHLGPGGSRYERIAAFPPLP